MTYPRDMAGYGRNPPDPRWPGGAVVAVQFVVNYEEGGENNILHGDAASEAFLSEIVGAQAWPGQRHMNMESIYEYGSRAGFWRLWRMFTARKIPVTVFGVATALQRNSEAVAAMREADWEIASHGLKWIDYKDFAKDAEREHMREAIRIHSEVTGARPSPLCGSGSLRACAGARRPSKSPCSRSISGRARRFPSRPRASPPRPRNCAEALSRRRTPSPGFFAP